MTETSLHHSDEADDTFENPFVEFLDDDMVQLFDHSFWCWPENHLNEDDTKKGSQSGQYAVAEAWHQSSTDETKAKITLPPQMKQNDGKIKMGEKICETCVESDRLDSSGFAKRQQASRKEKKTRLLPKQASTEMKKWLLKNCENPYPSLEKKLYFCNKYNLTLKSVERFFINGRRRYLWRFPKTFHETG